MLPTVNYHLTKACNFKCSYCYSTFTDIKQKELTKKEQFDLIKLLNESKLFKKINFAGGEPTLIPHIFELIKFAKSLGFETSIVTNGSTIDFNWIKSISAYLDILAISIDSIDPNINLLIGRCNKNLFCSMENLKEIAEACHLYGVHLKINTVVCKFNKEEILTSIINELKPFRWKILQVARIIGQNDYCFEKVKITTEEFLNFCKKNKLDLLPEIKVIEEDEELIHGSYLMIDPLGRFFESSNLTHNYSEFILKIGVKDALQQVSLNFTKFIKREGNYSPINF